jgi:hypothetical protein
MPQHKFKIGGRLFLVRSIDPKMPQGAYLVIKRLPKRDDEFDYQIKSVNGHHAGTMRESQLRTTPQRPY